MIEPASLQACLPAELRGPTTTITRIATGLSGAGVYRVDAAGRPFVLKVSADGEPAAAWRRKLAIQRRAADAGLTARVVHSDEERRAVVSAFVADRSFPAFYGDPRTRPDALAALARTLRRLHELPPPPDADAADPRGFLAQLWAGLDGFAVPSFVADAVARTLTEEPPAADRPPLLCHNDVNPTNLAWDGERVLLHDWDSAAPNDPFFDLGAIALFLRMDEPTCRSLLAAWDGAAAATLPARFVYQRRLVSVLCGVMFLHLARRGGHAGGAGTLDATASLADVYQRMRAGTLGIGSGDGAWAFALALVKEGQARL